MSVKGKSTDGPVSKLINRRISRRITGVIVRSGLPVTPNMVSLISFLIAAAAFPVFALGIAWLGGVLAQVSSIVDGVDGELARELGLSSRWGAFLDALLDRVADTLIVFGAAVYAAGFQSWPLPFVLAASVLSATGSLTVSYLHLRSQHDLGVHPVLAGPTPSIASRDVRLFVVFLGGVTGFVLESLLVIAVLCYAYLAAKMVELGSSKPRS